MPVGRDFWTSGDPWLRVALGLVSVAAGLVGQHSVVVLPWAVAVIGLDLVTGWLSRPHSHHHAPPAEALLALTVAAASVAAIAAGLGVPASPTVLPLLLIPAFRAGELVGRRGVAAVVLWMALVCGLTRWAEGGAFTADFASGSVLGFGLALAVGLTGAWASQLQAPEEEPSKARTTREAAALLRRLGTLAGSMEAGFDAPASAELMLDALRGNITARRSAVLVGYGDHPAVPLALRGSERVPWPDPTVSASPLTDVWRTGTSQIVSWTDDVFGERTLLVLALRDALGERLGVLVADREADLPFAQDDLNVAHEVADEYGGIIDVALSFAALREHAGMEERERLAREMHDGIAQELVAMGFRIDMAKRTFRERLPDEDNPLDEVRTDLTRVLTDLRSRIADLRLAVRPDRGLGAIIGERLQRAGSQSNLAVTLRLEETGFRLPAHVETLIYRLFLAVLADARHSPDATSFNVSLTVSAPQAFLRISHDGATQLHEDSFESHPLRQLGAEIVVDRGPDFGLIVQLMLNRTHRPMTKPPFISERIPHRS